MSNILCNFNEKWINLTNIFKTGNLINGSKK